MADQLSLGLFVGPLLTGVFAAVCVFGFFHPAAVSSMNLACNDYQDCYQCDAGGPITYTYKIPDAPPCGSQS